MSYVNARSNVNPTGTTPRTPRGEAGSYAAPGTMKKGDYVSVKPGYTINFYTDSTGQYIIGPSGGKGGQAANPVRKSNEYVGTTTGAAENGFVEVDWENSWYQDAAVKGGFNIGALLGAIGSIVKKGEHKTENRTSWVKIDAVNIKSTYTDPNAPDPEPDDELLTTTTTPAPASTGIDATTLGIAALAAAFAFSGKKGKRK